jgi:hypothetical protein
MQLIGMVSFISVGLTMINRVLEGGFIAAADATILNTVLVWREISVFGLFTVSVPNTSFFTSGIAHLVKWDYSFFGGNAAIIQYVLYAISAMAGFLLFTIMIGLIYQYFSRAR